jgi:O-antigen/teichoic acid export membrane protein
MTELKLKSNNTLYYLIPSVVMGALSIVSISIYTHIIPIEDYGALAICTVYALFVTSISNFGLSVGYERDFFERQNEIKRTAGLFYTIILFVFINLCFFGVLTYFFGEIITSFLIGEAKYSSLLFVSFLSTSITTIKNFFLTYLKNSQDGKSFMWFNIDESVIGLMLSFLMVLYFKIGILGIVLGQSIAGLIVLLLVGRKFILKLPFYLAPADLKESLRHSLFLMPKIFFGTVSSEADKLILGKINNSGGVGYYNIAQKFSYPITMFMVALQSKWSPQVYKFMFNGGDDAGTKIGNYLTPYLYYSIAAAVIVVSFAEDACKVMLPASYTIVPELIYIFAILNSIRFFTMQPQLIFAKKTGLLSLITFRSIFFSLVIAYPMVIYFGVKGAAWGFLIGTLINAIIHFRISQNHYRINWEYLKISLILGLFLISTAAAMLLAYFEIQYFFRLGLKMFLLGSFLFAGYKLKYVGISNMKRIFQ